LCGAGVAALFDCGSGTKDRIAGAGVRLGDVTHIVVTHGHVDHWSDLLALLFYRCHAPDLDRRAGLVIAVPPGACERVRSTALAADRSLLEENADIEWVEVAPGATLDGGWFRARAYAMAHGREPANGYRVEGLSPGNAAGWSVAYTGDTGPCADLVEAARGVGCLVCECSYPRERAVASHMAPEQVRALADEARPGLVVLTHAYPEMLEQGLPGRAFDGYAGRVVVAYDGLVVPLVQSPGAPTSSARTRC
jgi:ribonuclease BN (tRNA processing enzyme)